MVVGVALSGGAVRGVAHCGVLSVLDEAGVPIGPIAGTSAGSGVAAAYRAGVPPGDFAVWLEELRWPMMARPTRPGRLGFFSLSPMAERLKQLIGEPTFDELSGPLGVVATDLVAGRRVVITEGDVIEAVSASSAVPGLFTPVLRDGTLLVDGGLVDNYPVSVPRSLGARVVIGVDIGSEPHPRPPKNLLEVMVAAAEVRGVSTGVRELADVHIVPDVRGFSSFDFDSMPEMYERGRAAAREALPSIERLVG